MTLTTRPATRPANGTSSDPALHGGFGETPKHSTIPRATPTGADALEPLIEELYRAAVHPERWPAFLEGLAQAVRADAMTLLAASVAGGELQDLTLSLGADPQAERDYRDYFAGVCPWIAAGALEAPRGRAFPGESFVSESELTRTEYYNDYYKRNGWHHNLAANLFENEDGIVAVVGGHRSKSAGPFSSEEIQLLDRLVPHLRRALRLRQELECVTVERDAEAQLLERVSVGTILVDERGRVVRANRIAESILSAHDGLDAGPEGLEAATRELTNGLRQAIAGAAATSRGEGEAAGARFRLERPSGRAPYLLEVSPISLGAAVWGSTKSLAAILVTDGNGGVQPDLEALRCFYELTPAEAELTALLARGLSLEEAAAERRVSRNTARGQLKRIFSKTGTNRQAELVRMVLQGPAGFARR